MDTCKMAKIFLSLGSNIGNRKQNLHKAYSFIKTEITNCKLSRIYETFPLYLENQPKFLNCVVSGETEKSPYALLDYCLNLENKLGRDRTNSIDKQIKGPRKIDIDILLFNNKIIHSKRLQIPHPGMYERQFVLVPLLELAPELKDPETGYYFSFFLDKLNNQGISIYTEPECKITGNEKDL